jgi:hypothetical protein
MKACNNLAACIIGVHAFGPQYGMQEGAILQNICNPRPGMPALLMPQHERERLLELYNCFILPLTCFYYQMVGWREWVEIHKILQAPIKVIPAAWSKKGKQGIWSERFIQGLIDNDNVTYADRHKCKGLFYPYIRLMVLIRRDLRWHLPHHLMPDEMHNIGDPLNANVVSLLR